MTAQTESRTVMMTVRATQWDAAWAAFCAALKTDNAAMIAAARARCDEINKRLGLVR